MNCQPWRQGNCSYGNWIAVVTPSFYHNSWNNFTLRMEDKSVCLSKERRDGRHTEQERVLHTLPLSVSSLTMQLVPAYPSPPWWRWENKGQGSTPHFRLLVWFLTHVVMLPCTPFIRTFQHPTCCKRHGEICYRGLTPCSPHYSSLAPMPLETC